MLLVLQHLNLSVDNRYGAAGIRLLLLPDTGFWICSVVCKTEEMQYKGIDLSYLPKLKSIFLPTLLVLIPHQHMAVSEITLRDLVKNVH